jgi:hypothetical protein
MSNASIRAGAPAMSRIERLEPWFAAIFSTLLHVLLFLLLMFAPQPIVSTPQGAAGGGRVKVDLIGKPRRAEPVPPHRAARATASERRRKPSPTPAAAPPVQSALVAHARNPLPPDSATALDAMEAHDDVSPPDPQQPAAPDDAAQNSPRAWTGRPPGMLDENTAPENAGLAGSPAVGQGSGRNPDDAGPSLEIGGYLVYYDLSSEIRLRAWQAQGMKEIFILLPGTRYRMACPLEIALRRGSGKCRLLAPDAPDAQAIGDAREVISMLRVYHRGDLLWSGPGPYR